MNKLFPIVLVFLLSSLVASEMSYASGTIRGNVYNKSGQPLYPSEITVLVNEHFITTTTDSDGRFIILNIPIGVYDIECTSPGYVKQKITDVPVRMNESSWLLYYLKKTEKE